MATHAAEEVPYKHYYLSPFCVVEISEWDLFATFVQHGQLSGCVQGRLIWFGVAFAVRLCHGASSDEARDDSFFRLGFELTGHWYGLYVR